MKHSCQPPHNRTCEHANTHMQILNIYPLIYAHIHTRTHMNTQTDKDTYLPACTACIRAHTPCYSNTHKTHACACTKARSE
jgi:hypothetical protein